MSSHLPSPREMYRALLERDATFDGLFFAAVKTTGVFCRPVCPARKPRPENITWFPTGDAAERAGFRPCKRCRPDEAPGRHPDWIAGLIAAIERDPERRWTDEDLRAAALSPVRTRRYFRARFGMTFQAWQRARRLGFARADIANGRSTLAAGLDAGWESQSGFREAFVKLFGEPPARAQAGACLVACELSSPLGPLLAAASTRGVALLEFADRRGLRGQTESLRRVFGVAVIPGQNTLLERLALELQEYFAGARARFTVPVDLAGTTFQRAVWERLLAIPCGTTRSYREIAAEVGRPGAQRAVGRANGLNRVAILVPCHRVVRDDGTLCGYGGGLWRKRWLLDHERALIARDPNASRPHVARPTRHPGAALAAS